VAAASGRSYSVCGRNVAPPAVPATPADAPHKNGGYVWFSGATLLLMLLFSVYVVERPPVFASDLRASQPGIAGAGYTTAISYDGLGRRIAIATTTGGVATTLHYGWCGAALCQERTATDAVARRYLAEGEADLVNNNALFYATDHLGSVRDVVSLPSGLIANHFDYDPYGNVTTALGSHLTYTDFRYAGLFYLQTSGLYLATNRAYDPTVGRWLSRDPIAEQGGLNLYQYVGSNPLNYSDPSGLAGGAGPVYQGQAGVNQFLQQLQNTGANVGTEITVDTPSGTVRLDVGMYDPTTGNLSLTEVKNGPGARLNSNQKACFPDIQNGQGVPRGPNFRSLGVPPGGPRSMSLDIENLNGANARLPQMSTPVEIPVTPVIPEELPVPIEIIIP